MSSTIRTREPRVVTSETSAWKLPRFQRFVGIVCASALLASLVGVMCLKGDVDDVTKNKIPYIQDQLNQYEAHLHHA